MRTVLFAAITLLSTTPLFAQDPEFIRVVRDKEGNIIALETAIVRYEKGDGAEKVSLEGIGAIHIGDKSYYQKLNERFRGYDALCYELVGKKGDRPTRERFDLYGMIGTMLDLQGQLSGIDYSPENFVHADMSPEEMRRKLGERGENPFGILLESLKESFENPAPEDDPKSGSWLDGPVQVKRMLAAKFISDTKGSGLGPTMEQYIVKDRNEVALQVVEEQFQAGKKNVGLFYGAAHFPDFHQRLTAKGFKVSKTTWVRAWDLSESRSWDVGGILKKFLSDEK